MRAGGPKVDSLDEVQYGLHYGIVTQNKDPENLDRIKVRFPWLQNGNVDQTAWAQLLTPMEGKKYGWYNVPEIDDVVAVMFVAGDIGMPIILGGIWSTVDVSPEPNSDGKNNFRGYRSRCGSRLIFDDSGKVKVVFADKTAKNVLGIGEFAEEGEGPNKCAVYKPSMSGEKGVSFSTMEGRLEITCKDGKLKMTAGKNIKINAKTTIDVKVGGDTKLDGSSSATISSGSPSSYDAPKIKIA